MRRALALGLLVVLAAGAGWLLARIGVGPGAGRVLTIEEAPVGGLARPADVEVPELANQPVRNVVLVVADGMGVAQATAARLRAFGPAGRFLFERFPVIGLMVTEPSDTLVTDSDAGATAFASGEKTANGRVGTAPDGRPLVSWLERGAAAGRLTGIVTSTQVYDATPASFYAHVDRRRDYDAILDSLAVAPLDLVAGGGREQFEPESAGGRRTDGRDLLAEARARGTLVVTDTTGLASADRLPLWAIYPGGRLGAEPLRPDVAELTARALELLAAEADRREAGFLLVVEEEEVDSGAHHNDLERMTAGALRLDRALERIVAFAAGRGDTLVVVVADHSTGGLTIDQSSDAETIRVAWASGRHAGEPVPYYVWGPAAAAAEFGGLIDNTDLYDRLMTAAGLEPTAVAGGTS